MTARDAAPGQAAYEALASTWEAAAKRNRVHGQMAIDQGDESGSEGFVYAQTFDHCAAELRATVAAAAPFAVVSIEQHRWYAVVRTGGAHGEVVAVLGATDDGIASYGSVEEWEARNT